MSKFREYTPEELKNLTENYEVPSIDDMPNLKNSLGQYNTERVRYAQSQFGKPERTPHHNAQNIENIHIDLMQDKEPHAEFCYVDDIIQGIARLDHDERAAASKPLSVARLYNILKCMPNINSKEVMAMLSVAPRQAQRYVKACKLIIQHISRHLDK